MRFLFLNVVPGEYSGSETENEEDKETTIEKEEPTYQAICTGDEDSSDSDHGKCDSECHCKLWFGEEKKAMRDAFLSIQRV